MDTNRTMITILEGQLRQTRAAYYKNTPGITYDDMSASAKRVLEMRAAIERSTGRPVKTKVSKRAIAQLIRGL